MCNLLGPVVDVITRRHNSLCDVGVVYSRQGQININNASVHCYNIAQNTQYNINLTYSQTISLLL